MHDDTDGLTEVGAVEERGRNGDDAEFQAEWQEGNIYHPKWILANLTI